MQVSMAKASKSTRVVGWSAARRAASPRAALSVVKVTGPGARPVKLQKRSGGKWKTVRTVRTSKQRRLDLASLAESPGAWRLVVRPWRGWPRKTTSPLRIQAQEATFASPLLAAAKPIKPIKSSPIRGRTRQIPNAAPTAAFSATVSNLSLAVDAAGSSDPDGTIAAYAWNWGDNTTGTGRTASHSYSTAGSYQVSLTVTDDRGARTTTTRSVTTTAPAPTAECGTYGGVHRDGERPEPGRRRGGVDRSGRDHRGLRVELGRQHHRHRPDRLAHLLDRRQLPGRR